VRLAIPCFLNRLSPVFDEASQVLLVDVENSSEIARARKIIDMCYSCERARYLVDWEVDVLICGAISRSLKEMIEVKGIDVIGQICGDTEEVLQAYLADPANLRSFLMPGCKLPPAEFLSSSKSVR
jgi:predicted Fe-Mo cluster-binding NifX family protein